MEVTKTIQDGKVTLTVKGKLDAAGAAIFEKELDAAITESKDVNIKLQDVDYLASAGLRALVSGKKTIESEGGSLTLLNVQDIVREVFEFTGLTAIFDL
jgi:anti-anti-sigma factor